MDHSIPPQLRVFQIALGTWASQALFQATRLNIPTLIATKSNDEQKGLTASELAKLTTCNEDALFRLLRCLSSLGVFQMNECHKNSLDYASAYAFSLTDLSRCLVDGHDSFRHAILMEAGLSAKCWVGGLSHSIETGEQGFSTAMNWNGDVWSYLEDDANKENKKIFDGAMTSLSSMEVLHEVLIHSEAFEGLRSIVDIGGGRGRFISSILNKFSSIQSGTLLDLPSVVKKETLEIPDDLKNRIQVTGGSFFEPADIPKNMDCYIMKHIIHDWNDEKSVEILKTVATAMKPTSKILICDQIVSHHQLNPKTTMYDLHMMLMCNARERTLDQFKKIISDAGLKYVRYYGTPESGSSCLIEAVLVQPNVEL